MPPKEHHDAAGTEDHGQGEAPEKAKPTHTQPGRREPRRIDQQGPRYDDIETQAKGLPGLSETYHPSDTTTEPSKTNTECRTSITLHFLWTPVPPTPWPSPPLWPVSHPSLPRPLPKPPPSSSKWMGEISRMDNNYLDINDLEQESHLTTEAHTQSGQQTSSGKPSYQPQNLETAFYCDRSALRLPETPLTRPPPEPPPAAGKADIEKLSSSLTVLAEEF